jgi:hypothetical protein
MSLCPLAGIAYTPSNGRKHGHAMSHLEDMTTRVGSR